MKKVLATERKPIKMWLDDIENGALDQAKNLANLPFIHSHVALMPDCHLGYGMPIGGVIATENVVIPNAVGVDISCGVCAVKTSLTDISRDDLKKIMGVVRETVPVGKNHHKEYQKHIHMPDPAEYDFANMPIVNENYIASRKQVGTLGGGNHYIQIDKGDDGHVWIQIHSGSRNLGYRVANHYNSIAVEKNERWYSSVPKKWELAFFPIDSKYYHNYLKEMEFCIDFAFANRKLMMERVCDSFSAVLGHVAFESMLNIAHNYARLENHFGKNVMVHRKGATSARKGELGIIPGSQGTSSYIVEGLGNRDSFTSCSHGAGRVLGRKQACKTLDLATEQKRLDDLGVIHGLRTLNNLDEAPGAYKNIDTVMENQKDLVKIITKLTPLAIIKG